MRRLPSYINEQPDVVFAPGQYTDFSRNRRIRIFLSVLAISLLISLSYTLLRPAIYESRATLLVIPPATDERISDTSNTQHVELELQQLAGHSLLAVVLETLSSANDLDGVSELTLSDLDEMLEAVPVTNTNLVELVARGPAKELLPAVINVWIEVYQNAQADSVAAKSAYEITETEQQLGEVRQRVTEKRQQLDQFRKDYDIVSMERNENRMMKQLSGLTDSLNKANEEMIAARSRHGAIKAAMAEGRPVVSEHGQDSLTNLEQRLVEIQEELKELELEFTPHYMAIDPKIKGLVRKRDLLVDEIANNQLAGQQIALAEAEQGLETARQSVLSLQAQLVEQKQQVMDFTTKFTEHEALQEELLQLETVYREVQGRLMQNQVNSKRQYPQIEVREAAFLPERAIYPNYLRDSGLSVAASVLLGLLVLWLYDFLNRPGRQSGMPQLNSVFVSMPGTPVLEQGAGEQLSGSPATLALTDQMQRELSVPEVFMLLESADLKSRLLITLLLSGMSDVEVSAMQVGDIGLSVSVSELTVKGQQERKIILSPSVVTVITGCLAGELPVDAPVCPDSSGGALGPADLGALLTCAAHDAGLANPAEISPRLLRHTYIIFLVRQGIRLSDLSKITGDMPPAILAGYTAFSPPGSGRSLDSIERTYPALMMLS